MQRIYKDTTTARLKGESWKDLKGYEGTYQVSSLGRVRSLDRTIPHPRLFKQFVQGRILKQKVMLERNIKTGKPSVSLQVALTIEGKTKFFNVRRLVYQAFVESTINFQKDSFVIVNKNGNGYNNSVSNCIKITLQEKSAIAFKRGRVGESYLKYADRSKWKKPYGGAVNRKPVSKYSIRGRLIKQYSSITEASRDTGLGEKEIINVAKGRYDQWNGFVWKYSEKK
jgi:hypothetical protein